MTTPNPNPKPPLAGFFGVLRRTGLVRTSDRWIGGVAAGFAHRIGISPNAMRLILAVCVVFLGLSVWVYLIAWLLMPDENTGRIALETLLTPR